MASHSGAEHRIFQVFFVLMAHTCLKQQQKKNFRSSLLLLTLQWFCKGFLQAKTLQSPRGGASLFQAALLPFLC